MVLINPKRGEVGLILPEIQTNTEIYHGHLVFNQFNFFLDSLMNSTTKYFTKSSVKGDTKISKISLIYLSSI
jgi:hypothetical protein